MGVIDLLFFRDGRIPEEEQILLRLALNLVVLLASPVVYFTGKCPNSITPTVRLGMRPGFEQKKVGRSCLRLFLLKTWSQVGVTEFGQKTSTNNRHQMELLLGIGSNLAFMLPYFKQNHGVSFKRTFGRPERRTICQNVAVFATARRPAAVSAVSYVVRRRRCVSSASFA